MLSLMRKHAASWLIKVTLYIIIIVFIFWGGYSYTARRATWIAKVNSNYITINDFNKAYENLVESYRRRFGAAFSETLKKSLNLKKRALDMLIERLLLTDVIQELDLGATVEELQKVISNFDAFKVNGQFDPNRYNRVLRQVHLSPGAFESQQALQIALAKLQALVLRNAKVSDDEVKDYYHFRKDQVKVVYSLFDSKDFKVKPDPKKVEAYFNDHKGKYEEPEKRQFDLVVFRYSDLEKGIKVEDSEIKYYYKEHKRDFYQEKRVKARHILFKVPPNATKQQIEEIRAKAESVLKRAKRGDGFSALAKKYSEDKASAVKGGELGFFTYKQMVKPFAEAAFDLKPGQISNLVRTRFGFHIIKVEEIKNAKTLPLEEVKEKIVKKLKEQRAKDLAEERAASFADLAFSLESVDKAAKQEKIAVARSGVIDKNKPLPLIGRDPKVIGQLFELNEKDISQPIQTGSGIVVGQVIRIKEPAIPEFKEVKKRVEKDWEKEEAKQLARDRAEKILEAVQKGKDLKKVAEKEKIKIKETDWFSREKPSDGLGGSQDLLESIFSRTKQSPYPEKPMSLLGKFVVYQVVGWKAADEKGLEKERKSIYSQLFAQKKRLLWDAWLEQVKRQAEIKILKEEYKF